MLFDWDGTLLDSFKADTNAYLQMFRALGVPWNSKRLAQHYSPDWHNVYRAAKLPPESWAEADRLWRRFYGAERPLLHAGARHVVQTLHQLDFEPGSCVYIGDAPEDVKMARHAGVAVVGVLQHSPVPDRLRESRPNALIKTISALPELFCQS